MIRRLTLFRSLVHILQSAGALTKNEKKSTKYLADTGRIPQNRALEGLKRLWRLGIVRKSPVEWTGSNSFIVRRVRGNTNSYTLARYQADAEFIHNLARESQTAARIVGTTNLFSFDMRREGDRERFNAITAALIEAGFNEQRLPTYGFARRSYFWWLAPRWRELYDRLLRPGRTLD
jgi:hypothetical protein